jgi:SAM-dependent methyltransferase
MILVSSIRLLQTGVAKCDFLNVIIEADLENCWQLDIPTSDPTSTLRCPVVKRISVASFDVVVMSLVLSYFPTAAMRFRCCRNAWEVLKPNGLLLMVTPDSKRNGKNDLMVKSWKIGLGFLGFQRIAHDKLAHVQCMAFRKNPYPDIQKNEAGRWLKSFRVSDERLRHLTRPESFNPETLMFIPQDFRDDSQAQLLICREAVSDEDKLEGFLELPLSV